MLWALTSFLQEVPPLLLVGGNLLKSVNELDLLAVGSAAAAEVAQPPEWSYATSTILRARDDD